MSILICEIQGVRGRSMRLYDNKCVITTDVTLGSLLTNNALDGMKTIFFCDVVGVQYKRSGATIGYLQLETPASQMNNKASNMFSENTFTFENGNASVSNNLMDKIHDFIVDRLEAYKYNGETDIMKNPPMQLINRLKDARIRVGDDLNRAAIQHKEMLEQQEKEKMAQKKAAEEQYREEMRAKMQDISSQDGMAVFIKGAVLKDSFAEIHALWLSLNIEKTEISEQIEAEIRKKANSERAYGKDTLGCRKYIEKLREKLGL